MRSRSPHLRQHESSSGISGSQSYTLIKATPRTRKETRPRAWTDYQFAAIGLALVAFGAAALFAWHVPLPGEPLALYPLRPVSYGTAIGFLLCGIAMVAVVTECVTLARFCAALVTATAAIRLIGYALNTDFSSSLTFVTSGAPANPAIMGPLTALSFVLAACALAVLAAHERRALRFIVGALLASAILTVSLISLFAYLSGNRLVYEWLELGGGEFPIFIAFLALGASVIFFIFFGGAEGAIAARKWLPIPAWFGVFIGTLVLWQALSAHEYREITRTLTGTADSVQAILVSAVRARTDSLRRLEQRLNLYQPTQQQWMSDAYRLLRDYPGTTAIYFANPSFDVDWAAPADVTSALGHDLESEDESAQALRSALASGGAAMTRFMELSISGRGFNIFVPAYRGGDFAGVIAGVYRAEPFFEAVLADNHPGFSVALSQDGELIHALREGTSRLAAIDQSFAVNDQVWSLRIAPTSETMSQLRSRLPEAVLIAGFILATLIALSIYLYQTAEARREEIEMAHEDLQREVAERRLAEQQLEISRDFYLRLFSEFPNLVWRSDPSGKCDYFNQAWLDYTGRTLAQELGDGWADGVHPDDIEFCLAAYKEASEARRPFAMEYRLRRADGSYGWLYDVGRPYYDVKGAFRGYLGTCYDIDERRRMETALKESASRFRAMAANVPGAMLQLVRRSEGDYVFPYLSKGIANLCGVEAEAIASDAQTLFSLMPPEDRQQLTDTLETSAHTLSRFSWNGRIVLADESERWVNLRASPSRLAGGAVMWDGFLFDETEERRAQLEIERSRAQLRALSTHLQTVREEEKANVARELHDELGGKLAALKMGAAWLSGKLTPNQSALLAKTQDLARLADEAVAGVRRMITALRPTVLDDLGLVAAMQWQTTEFRRRFAIECRLTVDAEDIAVDEGTALALFRIFQEALHNVARHAQATRVLASFDHVDDAYVLRVADDGVGIADEQIFTPASHGIRDMMERAQKLKGEISVRGIRGEGTVVTVTIPKAGAAGRKSAAS